MAAKKLSSPNVHSQDFLERIKDSSLFQKLEDNVKFLPFVFLFLILFIALAYQYASKKAGRAESSYLLAESTFDSLKKSMQGEADVAVIEQRAEDLQKIASHYPELRAKYDGLLAQLFIALNRPQSAEKLAKRSLDRTKGEVAATFGQFSATTLLVSEGNLEEALKNAHALKDAMLPYEETHQHALFVYNLLRIAILEQQAGTPQGERQAWQEWRRYTDKQQFPAFAEAALTIERDLQEGAFTVADFIAARESALNQNIEK